MILTSPGSFLYSPLGSFTSRSLKPIANRLPLLLNVMVPTSALRFDRDSLKEAADV